MRVPGILLTFVSKSFALRRRMREKSGMMSYPVMRFDRPAAEAKQGRNRDHGQPAEDEAQFLKRYEGLTSALLDNPKMMGFCYTQLYDIEQEQNGLYNYERAPKTDISAIKRINTRKAAIED